MQGYDFFVLNQEHNVTLLKSVVLTSGEYDCWHRIMLRRKAWQD